MLNIKKVRKAQQGLQIPGGLMNITGLQGTQTSVVPNLINLIAVNGYLPNPYMNNNPNPISKNISNGLNQSLDILGSFISPNNGYYGKYGGWQLAGDLLYNNVSNTLGSINPAFGLAMKGLGLVNKMSPSTDSMTRQDAIFNSIPILNLINTAFGKKTLDFNINQEAINLVGSGYLSTVGDINKADLLKNKKYGLFSNRARKKANLKITDAKNQQAKLTSIANENYDLLSIASSMSDLNNIGYFTNINGGLDPRYLSARKGGTLKRIKNLKFHKLGGLFEPIIEEVWEPIISDPIEEFLSGGKVNKLRTLEELIEFAKYKNPRFILRLSEAPKSINFIDDEGNLSTGSHYLEWGTDDKGNAIVYPRILEVDGELKLFDRINAYNRALENNNYLIMTPEEAKLFTNSGEDKDGNLFGYKKGWPQFFRSFRLYKEGGKTEELDIPEIEETSQKNVIPEGALHKNKHHIENTEGLTLKGIPVIDNEGDLLAEIEKEEIIFTLEVTKKLEELCKEGTDEAAIKAGKLLVLEILFNTEDNAGLINSLKNGGIINETK